LSNHPETSILFLDKHIALEMKTETEKKDCRTLKVKIKNFSDYNQVE